MGGLIGLIAVTAIVGALWLYWPARTQVMNEPTTMQAGAVDDARELHDAVGARNAQIEQELSE